jgi:hypothetical protein
MMTLLNKPYNTTIMKKLKFSYMIIAILFIASFSQLNAQAVHWETPVPFSIFVPCANDGLGELIEGTLLIHFTWDNNGGVLTHPHGEYLIGATTGIKYRAVGVQLNRTNASNENGTTTHTYIDRRHFVGKGTQFYLKTTYHHVNNSDGEKKITKDKSEVICK